jgi:hypothetical protein
MKTMISYTGASTFRRCPKEYWFRYKQGLEREPSDALRFGAAFHKFLELAATKGVDETERAFRAEYPQLWARIIPEEAMARQYECETICALGRAHVARYTDEVVAVEQDFETPIVNPISGRQSRRYRFRGRIDRIVRLPNGALAVQEIKTTSQDISPTSPFWLRLRMDAQVTGYVVGARALGFDVSTVLYDVVRKPTIRPTKRGMAPQEWGARLNADIAERPDWYFARQETVRLPEDIAQWQSDLWGQCVAMAYCDKNQLYTRNIEACQRFNAWCPFLALCSGGWQPGDPVPEEFRRRSS